MNYYDRIAQLMDEIKADSNVRQPWKNKTVSKLLEAQAFVQTGTLSTLNKKSILDPSTQSTGAYNDAGAECICPLGAISKDCLARVHRT